MGSMCAGVFTSENVGKCFVGTSMASPAEISRLLPRELKPVHIHAHSSSAQSEPEEPP